MYKKKINVPTIFVILNSCFIMYIRNFKKLSLTSCCQIHFKCICTPRWLLQYVFTASMNCNVHVIMRDRLGSDPVFCLHKKFLNKSDIDHLSIWFAILMRLIVNKIHKCLQVHRENTTAMNFISVWHKHSFLSILKIEASKNNIFSHFEFLPDD